jgi:hypothetical protein
MTITSSPELLNISSNLRRIAVWAYEYPNEARVNNINTFLNDTKERIKTVETETLSQTYADRFARFLKEFERLFAQWPDVADNHIRRLVWAEHILTWSNLLD